jgi:hypothetical protein
MNQPAYAYADTGRSLLRALCIVSIAVGALSLIFILSGLSAFLASGLLMTIIFCIAVAFGLLQIILGSIGLKKSADPSQAGFFVVSGVILGALNLVSFILAGLVLGFISASSWNAITGFILPVLFIVYGFNGKKRQG